MLPCATVALIVQKYGGTSVADADRIKAVAEHVAFTRRPGPRPVVVVVAPWARRPTTSSPWPTPCPPPSPAARWTCCSPSASARAWRCCAWPWPTSGVDAVSFTGSQVGHHHRQRPRQGQDPRGQGRPGPRRAGRGQGLRRRRLPGHLDRARRSPPSAGAAPTPPPWRWPRRSSADSCEIYTDVTGVFSADPRIVPQARKLAQGPLRRDAGDGRRRRPGAGAALGRVRPQPPRRRCTCAPASPGSRAPGSPRRSRTWKTRSSPASPTTCPRPRSRSATCPTDRASSAALFEPLADANINVDMIVQNTSKDGIDRHLLHHAQGRHGGGREDRGRRGRRDRRRRRHPRRRHRQGVARRRRA